MGDITIDVVIHEATGLKDQDKSMLSKKKMDPYFILSIPPWDKEAVKSSIFKNMGGSFKTDDKPLTLHYHPMKDGSGKDIHIKIFDSDEGEFMAGDDDPVGTAVVSIGDLSETKPVKNKWVDVVLDKKKEGQICISLAMTVKKALPDPAASPAPSTPVNTTAPTTPAPTPAPKSEPTPTLTSTVVNTVAQSSTSAVEAEESESSKGAVETKGAATQEKEKGKDKPSGGDTTKSPGSDATKDVKGASAATRTVAPAPNPTPPTGPKQISKGYIRVKVTKAEGLVKTERFGFGNLMGSKHSDPYLRVYVDPFLADAQCTQPMKGAVNVEWTAHNDLGLKYHGTSEDGLGYRLMYQVFDKNDGKDSDTSMGEGEVSLHEVVAKGGSVEGWFPLFLAVPQKTAPESRGRVKLHIEYSADPIEPAAAAPVAGVASSPTVDSGAKPLSTAPPSTVPGDTASSTAATPAPVKAAAPLTKLHKGFVSVKITKGTNLPKMDVFSHSDPYVKFYIEDFEGESVRSKAIKGGNNVTWSEGNEFIVYFHGSSDDGSNSKLIYEMWDEDSSNKDDMMGKGEVSLLTVANNPLSTLEEDFPLVLEGKDRGSITLTISYKENTAPEVAKVQEAVVTESKVTETTVTVTTNSNPDSDGLGRTVLHSSSQSPPVTTTVALAAKLPKGFVHVRVLEGIDLPKMDTFSHSDPYVKVYVPPHALDALQTNAIKGAANCKWTNEDKNELALTFHGSTDDGTGSMLVFEVWDRDSGVIGNKDDLMGRGEIDLRLIASMPDSSCVNDFNLSPQGKVKLQIQYSESKQAVVKEETASTATSTAAVTASDKPAGGPAGPDTTPVATTAASPLTPRPKLNPGFVKVNVLAGRNLLKTDGIMGYNDPYVKLYVGTHQGEALCTKVIKGGKEVVWRKEDGSEIVLVYHGSSDDALTSKLVYEVWDKDSSVLDSSDDLIGEGKVSLYEVLKSPHGIFENWLPLSVEGKEQGQLQLKIEYSENSNSAPLASSSVSVAKAVAPLPKGYIHIKVLEARDLPDSDAIGYNDPYVRLFVPPYDKDCAQTDVIKGGKDVEWRKEHRNNFAVQFRGSTSDGSGSTLAVEVWDKDSSVFDASDDILCKGEVSLHTLLLDKGGQMKEWFPLELPKGLKGGKELKPAVKLHLIFTQSAVGDDIDESDNGAVSGEIMNDKLAKVPLMKLRNGFVNFKVLEGRNLPKADVFGYNDPFVRVSIPPHEEDTASSGVAKGGKNVVWGAEERNSFTLLFHGVSEDGSGSHLRYELMDKDGVGGDDVMGSGEIALCGVAAQGTSSVEGWFALTKPGGGDAGALRLYLEIQEEVIVAPIVEVAKERDGPATIEMQPDDDDEVVAPSVPIPKGTLHVKILEGKDFPLMDGPFFANDPYVKCFIPPFEDEIVSSGVAKGGVNVTWPDTPDNTLSVPCHGSSSDGAGSFLHFHVWDKDIGTSHDKMGEGKVYLGPLVKPNSSPAVIEGWFPMSLNGAKKGSLKVKVTFEADKVLTVFEPVISRVVEPVRVLVPEDDEGEEKAKPVAVEKPPVVKQELSVYLGYVHYQIEIGGNDRLKDVEGVYLDVEVPEWVGCSFQTKAAQLRGKVRSQALTGRGRFAALREEIVFPFPDNYLDTSKDRVEVKVTLKESTRKGPALTEAVMVVEDLTKGNRPASYGTLKMRGSDQDVLVYYVSYIKRSTNSKEQEKSLSDLLEMVQGNLQALEDVVAAEMKAVEPAVAPPPSPSPAPAPPAPTVADKPATSRSDEDGNREEDGSKEPPLKSQRGKEKEKQSEGEDPGIEGIGHDENMNDASYSGSSKNKSKKGGGGGGAADNIDIDNIMKPPPPPQIVIDRSIPTDVRIWRVQHVCNWLVSLGFEQHCPAFIDNAVNGLVLISLEDADLQSELNVTSKLHRVSLMMKIKELLHQSKVSDQRDEEKKVRDDALKLKRKLEIEARQAAVEQKKVAALRAKAEIKVKEKEARKEIDFTKVAGMSKIRLAMEIKAERERALVVADKFKKERTKWSVSYDSNPPPEIVRDEETLRTRVHSPERKRMDEPPPPPKRKFLTGEGGGTGEGTNASSLMDSFATTTKGNRSINLLASDETAYLVAMNALRSDLFKGTSAPSANNGTTLSATTTDGGPLIVDPSHSIVSSDLFSFRAGLDSVVPWWSDVLEQELKYRLKVKLRVVPPIATVTDVIELTRTAIVEFGFSVWRRYKASIDEEPEPYPSGKEMAEVCFQAFVAQKINASEWLGGNDKLTRLKFDGGLRSILLLKLTFAQFDILHRVVEPSDNGSITIEDFTRVFVKDFTSTAKIGQEMEFQNRVKDCLFEICESLEFNKLTLSDAFDAFDRLSDGAISVAEFTSFIKQFSRNSLSKSDIFKILSCMDINFDHTINKKEFLEFFAFLWCSRLRKLKSELTLYSRREDSAEYSLVTDRVEELKDRIHKLKGALWRSFGKDASAIVKLNKTNLIEPFAALHKLMGLAEEEEEEGGGGAGGTGTKSTMTFSAALVERRRRTLNVSGKNELLRVKILRPHTSYGPHRAGFTLSSAPSKIELDTDAASTDGGGAHDGSSSNRRGLVSSGGSVTGSVEGKERAAKAKGRKAFY